QPKGGAGLGPPFDLQTEALRTVARRRDDAVEQLQRRPGVLLGADGELCRRDPGALRRRWVDVQARVDLLVEVEHPPRPAARPVAALEPFLRHRDARPAQADITEPGGVYLVQGVH